jgi:tetratricopeptide (TPR) repeat protein
MSLVNQMLKDLAKRQKKPLKPEIVLSGLQPSFNLHKSDQKKVTWRLFLIFILLLSLLLTVLFPGKIINLFHRKVLPIPDSVLVSKEHASLNDEAIMPLPTPHPAILTAITFQLQHDMTFLRFLLTENVLYRVSTDDYFRHLIIILDNAHLSAESPILNYKNSALTNIKMMNQADGSLKIILTLQPGAELKHVNLMQSNQMPELQLDLFYAGINPDNHFKNKSENMASIKQLIVNTNDESLYQKALNTAAEGEIEEASSQLRSLIDRTPHYHKAREALIGLLLQEGGTAQANKILQAGLRLAPDHIPFIALQAKLLLDNGKYHEAYQLLKQNKPPINHYPDYYGLLAVIYQHQGRALQAAELYRSLVQIQTAQSKWWVGLGVALESLGKKSSALVAYSQAEKYNKNLSPELRAYVEDKLLIS